MFYDVQDSVDVTASIFPSRRFRHKLEEDLYDEREDEEGEITMQRSLTSPPLLESFNRPPPKAMSLYNTSFDFDDQHQKKELVTVNRRREVQVTVEVHSEDNHDATSNNTPVSLLLSVEPDTQQSSVGREDETGESGDGEGCFNGKTFALKFSDDELEDII